VSPLEEALRRVVADLNGTGRPWALVGGLAVSARAEPRTTRDVDAAVAVSGDREAEELVRGLQSAGWRVLALVEHEAAHRLATVRLSPPGEAARGVVADLLFASSGIEAEVAAGAQTMDLLDALRAPVARVGHLIALKLLARDDRNRPQDYDDLRALLDVAAPADLDDARAAIALIARRGFDRGRDLAAALGEMEAERGR